MKRILKVFIFVFSFIALTTTAKAGSFGISANTKSVTVGNTVKVTVNVSNLAGKFQIYSSDNNVLSGGAEDWYESSTTLYFTAKSAGTATITVVAKDVADYDTGEEVSSSRSVTVNVTNASSGNSNSGSGNKKPVDINKTYSSDNTLKSLSVEGYDIEFSKDKLEYKLELDQDVESINIKATSNDENATVKGAGEIKLTDGINNIKIIVAAENGNEKVYTIVAEVKDLNPIVVKIGKEKYNVVKRVEQLSAPENFKSFTASIDSKEVPALYNDLTGYILVGLKDDKGNIKLYVYDPNADEYTLYNEMTFNNVKLYYTNPDKVPNGFKKVKLVINNEKVTAYKTDKNSDFYLVYGMNVNRGEIGWYRYDSIDVTLQRYETKDLENLSLINNKYLITIVILSLSILMLLLFMFILMVKIRKKNIRD